MKTSAITGKPRHLMWSCSALLCTTIEDEDPTGDSGESRMTSILLQPLRRNQQESMHHIC